MWVLGTTDVQEARLAEADRLAKAAEDWDALTREEQEDIIIQKECKRLKAAAEKLYEASEYKGQGFEILRDSQLMDTLHELEEALIGKRAAKAKRPQC